MYYIFCSKCGRVRYGNPNWEERCGICGNLMKHIPEKYIRENEILTDKQCRERVNEPNGLYEELVKTSPEFDQYLFDHRDEILAKQSAEFNAKMAHGKSILEEQGRVAKCPSCGSTNVSKIGVVNRTVSTYFLGLGSSKIGKTHKCNHCGTTW